jgi:formylglycine-generating enzyme required for sulfatase activity
VHDAEAIEHLLDKKLGFNVLSCTDTSKPFGRFSTLPRRSNLLNLLTNAVQQARGADNLWFFFSGHGALGRGRDYLLTSDYVPNIIKDSSILIDFVIESLMACQPQNIMLVLDMCRDGIEDGSKSIGEVGTQTIKKAKHQGITTIFSCGRGEESYEIPEIQHGSFTYALLEGLEQYSTPRELDQYLGYRVPQVNKTFGKPAQNPLIIPEPGYKYDLPLLFVQSQQIKDRPFQQQAHQSFPLSRSVQDSDQRLPIEKTPKQLLDIFTFPSMHQARIFEFEVVTIDAYGQKNAQYRQKSQYLVEEIDKALLEMVVIPSGTFVMGSSERRPSANEVPLHSVTIKHFLMSKYPITKSQWKAVAKLEQVKIPLKLQPYRSGGAKHPIVEVSWDEAVEFCDRLSQKTGHAYRLPSEAEWEFACRAGTTTPFHFGETITPDLANYDGNFTYHSKLKGENRKKAIDVGSFLFANAFGLFDMHGNVWEWCLDHWHETYDEAPTDERPWFKNYESHNRVIRGGSWRNEPKLCRSSSRFFDQVDSKSNNISFRVIREL